MGVMGVMGVMGRDGEWGWIGLNREGWVLLILIPISQFRLPIPNSDFPIPGSGFRFLLSVAGVVLEVRTQNHVACRDGP